MANDPAMMADNAATPRGRWQFPLLIVAIAAFAAGLVRAVPKPVDWPMETLLARGAQLIDSESFDGAYLVLSRAVHKKSASASQHVQACRLLAGLLHKVEAENVTHSVAQAEQIDDLYERVAAHESELSGAEYVRWADALEWSKEPSTAVQKLREALKHGVVQSGAIRRRLIDTRLRLGANTDDLIDDHNALMADEAAGPNEISWSLRTRVSQLLDQSKTTECLALIARVAPRLRGTTQSFDVALLEAQVLARADQPDEAERRLRHMLSLGGPRDEAWAQCSLLLAGVLLAGGRAEEAMAIGEAVHALYAMRPQGTAALFELARCKFALGAYGPAVRDYREVVSQIGDRRLAAGVDVELLRATLAAQAADLNDKGHPRHGVALLHMARELLPADRDDQRAAFAAEEASLYLALAQLAPPDPSAEDAGEPQLSAAQLNIAAGEALLTVIEARKHGEQELSDTLWRAMDAFDAGGESWRNIALLTRFIDEQTRNPVRAAAIVRLANLRRSGRQFDLAAKLYQKVIDDYPRTQEGLSAIVPLAECWMALGGDDRRRAEPLLLQALHVAPQEQPLFDPRAPQYADALFVLANLLLEDKRYEEAIARLEAFRAFSPRDPRCVDAAFSLAVAYHHSGILLRAEIEKAVGIDARARIASDATARILRAERLYGEYIERSSAPMPQSDSAAGVKVRSAWLSRGDCLVDAGRPKDAQAMFGEAAWRFDGEPAGVTAMLRVIDCDRRAGRGAQADAALRRLWWLVQRMPDEAFSRASGSPSRAYWVEWIDRMIESRGS